MNRVATYLKETRAELKHVSWPTRKQAMWFTGLVVVISLVIAAYLGLFDLAFRTLLELVV